MNRRTLLLGTAATSLNLSLLGRSEPASATEAVALRGTTSAQEIPLETMAGQMLLFGFRGSRADQRWPLAIEGQIKNGVLGGVLLLRHNTRDQTQLTDLCALFREANSEHPALITLDHEGGAVQRLQPWQGFSRLPSARRVARNRSVDEAKVIYATAAAELRTVGVNVNLAPVLDMAINPSNPVIVQVGRAYGKTYETIVEYATAFVDAHLEAGVIPVLKHFPGHGSSRTDSHETVAKITGTWRAREIEPFRSMIMADKAPIIMTGHLTHTVLADGENLPATLSPAVVNGLLRTSLAYNGPVMTDDLEMRAIRGRYSLRDAVVGAINAGHDFLLISNSARPDRALPEKVRDMIVAAAEAGDIQRATLEASYARITAIKAMLKRGDLGARLNSPT